MEQNKKHIVLTIVVMVIITIGLIWLETYKRQREQFSLAEKYYLEKDFPKAIQCYDSAIHMYTPWSMRVKKSAEKLWELGTMYENQKDYDMALSAYRQLRSSFYAVRWLIQPYPEWITRCDEAIARVLKAQESTQEQPTSELTPPQNTQ